MTEGEDATPRDAPWQLRSKQRLTHHVLSPPEEDAVATEAPLQIRVDGEDLAVLMRSPGRDLDLGAGFLVSEGLIRAREALVSMETCQRARGSVLDIRLHASAALPPEAFDRRFAATASCGICGKMAIEAVRKVKGRLPRVDPIPLAAIQAADAGLRAGQAAFAHTGGVHAASISGGDGAIWALAEDVGRHNAADKAIGACFLAGREFSRSFMTLSGRISFEMAQKAAFAGIPAVIGVGAPTSLAIDLAEELDMLLVGFWRDGRGNVYAGADRIGLLEPEL